MLLVRESDFEMVLPWRVKVCKIEMLSVSDRLLRTVLEVDGVEVRVTVAESDGSVEKVADADGVGLDREFEPLGVKLGAVRLIRRDFDACFVVVILRVREGDLDCELETRIVVDKDLDTEGIDEKEGERERVQSKEDDSEEDPEAEDDGDNESVAD